jgi:hypothetical protein
MSTDSKVTFGKWDEEAHSHEGQDSRKASAKKVALTPISIDRAAQSAEFSGAHGHYRTTLDSCNCGDYRSRRLPCKHIYRLAIELGYISETAQSDKSQIVAPPVPLSELVHRLENCTDGVQTDLKYMLLRARRGDMTTIFWRNDNMEHLLTCGFVEVIPITEITFPTVSGSVANGIYLKSSTVRDYLTENGITGFKSNASLKTLAQWSENNPAAKEKLLMAMTNIALSPEVLSNARKLYSYLLRKFDYDLCFDDVMGEVKVPHGAEFVRYSTAPDGSRVSIYQFPDDEITHLLDMYNANRCRKFEQALVSNDL